MKHFVVAVLLMCSAFAKAQLESSYWYFGLNSGINFTNNIATPISDGQLRTLEGCATISDRNGNLLFYTDGSLVYNRNHTIMPNGGDLKGNSSSTSSAIIVPVPRNSSRYYILTVDTNDTNFSLSEGLHYSIVDLTLDNGLGDVDIFQKNVNLLPITSEKLTAVSNTDDTGYWVVTQFEDQFYSYEITDLGINIVPVISQVAPFIELINAPFTNMDVTAMRGYIKLNEAGDRLAAAHFSNNTSSDFNGITNINLARGTAYANGGELYLYDFNNASGVVSNPQPLMTKTDGGSFYGVEFSEDGSFLYTEADFMTPSPSQFFELDVAHVYQFDLNSSNIAASRTSIYSTSTQTLRGALQLGLDNRIYHAVLGETGLRTIETPNNAGQGADYREDNFDLAPGTVSQYGLPIFIQSFIVAATINGADHCFGTFQDFTVNVDDPIVAITWNFDDPASGSQNTSNEVNPSHFFSAVGIYEVSAVIETAFGTTTAAVFIEVFEIVEIEQQPTDLLVCNEGFNKATFNLNDALENLVTDPSNEIQVFGNQSDAFNNLNPINPDLPYLNQSDPQRIYVRVSNENCQEIITFTIATENCAIEIFNVLTPNEDGKNDTFFISGLRDVFLDHKLKIFNRYGQQVWEGDNNSPEWNGIANMGLASTDQRLPTGTYFYILELNDGESEPFSGYVYLQ
jgi:gliding motility-associated-like protein